MIQTIEAFGMLAPEDTVVLAVSGGADSMAMLHLFTQLRDRWRLRLHVAHLDHRLRPGSSADAAFVRAEAARRGLPVTVEAADVRTLAAREKRSIEEAGRAARYGFFARVAAHVGAGRVATAHTRDDQIETVLMALLAGGPWEMLSGIPPVRPLGAAAIIRPLREVSHGEVLAVQRTEGLSWRDDPTNQDQRVRRNWIRLTLLPRLREAQAGAEAALWDLGEAARRTDAVLVRLARARYGHTTEREDHTVHVARDLFRSLPAPLRRRLLAAAVADATGTVQPIPRVVMEQALRAADRGRTGREIPLGPARLLVGDARLDVVPAPDGAGPPGAYRLSVPGEVHAAGFGLVVSAELDAGGPNAAPRGPDEAVFDADCLGTPLRIRSWRPGDRFAPAGLGGNKKLQDFFVDAKIPRWRRSTVGLLTDGDDRILWVIGYRRSATCGVSGRTERVVRVRARRA